MECIPCEDQEKQPTVYDEMNLQFSSLLQSETCKTNEDGGETPDDKVVKKKGGISKTSMIIIVVVVVGTLIIVFLAVVCTIWCKKRREEAGDLKAYKLKEAERKKEAEKKEKEGHIDHNDIQIHYNTATDAPVYQFNNYMEQKGEVDLSQKSDKKEKKNPLQQTDQEEASFIKDQLEQEQKEESRSNISLSSGAVTTAEKQLGQIELKKDISHPVHHMRVPEDFKRAAQSP